MLEWPIHKGLCKWAVEMWDLMGVDSIEGVDKKIKEYKRDAADAGDLETQCKFGIGYMNGIGVAVDQHETVKWYTSAVVAGYTRAQTNGFLLRDGHRNRHRQGQGIQVVHTCGRGGGCGRTA